MHKYTFYMHILHSLTKCKNATCIPSFIHSVAATQEYQEAIRSLLINFQFFFQRSSGQHSKTSVIKGNESPLQIIYAVTIYITHLACATISSESTQMFFTHI